MVYANKMYRHLLEYAAGKARGEAVPAIKDSGLPCLAAVVFDALIVLERSLENS